MDKATREELYRQALMKLISESNPDQEYTGLDEAGAPPLPESYQSPFGYEGAPPQQQVPQPQPQYPYNQVNQELSYEDFAPSIKYTPPKKKKKK